MAVKDNRGQAKVKAKGTHGGGGSKLRGIGKEKKKKRARPQDPLPVSGSSSSSSSSGVVNGSRGLGDGDLRVLLLGEGDFGFAAALALEWGDCSNLTATTVATEAATLAMAEAEDNLETIKAFDGVVAFKVDAMALTASSTVMQRAHKGFDRIAFNFPSSTASALSHAAIEQSQTLLRGIFRGALSDQLLRKSSGELHVTLRPIDADAWKLVDIAKIAGLRMKSSEPFEPARYQGYTPPTSDMAVTYVFTQPPPKVDPEQQKALAHAALAKAHPELRLGPTGQTYKEAWRQRHKKSK